MQRRRDRRAIVAFTVPEVLVVCSVLLVMFGLLISVYAQAQFMLRHGSAKLEMHQKLRQASSRVIPYIASAVRHPDDTARGLIARPLNEEEVPEDYPFQSGGELSLFPILVPPPSPEDTIIETDWLLLRSTEAYVDKILRVPEASAAVLNARDPFGIQDPSLDSWDIEDIARRGLYRIFTQDVPGADQSDPELQQRMILLDGNTPGDPSDDIALTSGFHRVTFSQMEDTVVDVTFEARRYLPLPTGGLAKEPTPAIKRTRVFLPINTNTPE